MLQEFQWSRSLAAILLELTPRVWAGLPLRLRCQFLYCQLFYPLRGVMSLVGLMLPAVAMATAQPWVRVDYPLFLLLWLLQFLLSLLPLYWLKHLGLLNPPNSTLAGWEQLLFELTRGPWVLAGVVFACVDQVWSGARDFRVTNKQKQHKPLQLKFITPHLVLACLGALAALWLGPNAGESEGYVLLALISAFFSIAAALLALGLDHRLKRLPLFQLSHHYGIVMGACGLVVMTAVVRHQELRTPLQLTEALLSSQLWRP